MSITVRSLHIYPVKSCAAINLTQATFSVRGFAGDREWMIVRPDGSMITQREDARLALIQPQLSSTELQLSYLDVPPLRINLHREREREETGKRSSEAAGEISVVIWDDRCNAIDEGESAARWISTILQQPARLVRFNNSNLRPVDKIWTGETGSHVAFVDSLPLLIASSESLASLNRLRRAQGLDECEISRFRPNIVISGVKPFEEDELPALLLSDGLTKLEIIRPCSRCPMVDIDQSTGIKESKGNLALLGKHRRYKNYKGNAGAMFGVHAIAPTAAGKTIKVGELLSITEISAGLPPVAERLSK